MKKVYETQVHIRSGRDGSAKSEDGLLDTKLAFPKQLGGDGTATNPEQLFAAAYGACFASTLTLLARAAGTPIHDVSNNVTLSLSLGDEGRFHLALRFDIRAQGQTPHTVAALIEKAKATCAYARAVADRVPTEIAFAAS